MVTLGGKRRKLLQDDSPKLNSYEATEELEVVENLNSPSSSSRLKYRPLVFDFPSDHTSNSNTKEKKPSLETQSLVNATGNYYDLEDTCVHNQEKPKWFFLHDTPEIFSNNDKIGKKKYKNDNEHTPEQNKVTTLTLYSPDQNDTQTTASESVTHHEKKSSYTTVSMEKKSSSVGVNTEKELLSSSKNVMNDVVTCLNLTVLGRFPLLNLVQRDGSFTNSLIIFSEIQTLCSVIRTLRIRFSEVLTNIVSSFLKPNDQIEIDNLFQVKLSQLFNENLELHLGAQLKENYQISSVQEMKNMIAKPLSMLTKIRITRPNVVKCSPFECFFDPASDASCLYNSEIPNWATTQELPCEPTKEKETFYHFQLQDSTHQQEINNTPLEEIDDSLTKPRYEYSKLVSLVNSTYCYFYGCVVEVSRMIRPLLLPKYGRVVVMNIDIVDPSIASTFRSSLLVSNPAKINVCLIAQDEAAMPFLATGDIIRVHRSRLSVRQNFSSGNIFLDTNYVSGVTSIHLWRLNIIKNDESPYCVNSSDETNITKKDNSASSKKKGKNGILCCYWKSQPLVPQDAEKKPPQLSKQPKTTLTHYDNCMLQELSNWSYESLFKRRCFTNIYLSSLSRLVISEQLNKYVDLIVKVLDIEREKERPGSVFGIDSNFDILQDSMSSSTIDLGITICSNQKYSGNNLQVKPDTELRILVTDNSIDSDKYNLWILSKFSTSLSHYLEDNVAVGDWLRVRNVAFSGIKRLRMPSKFIESGLSETEFYLLDGFRAKVTLMPPFVNELHSPTVHS